MYTARSQTYRLDLLVLHYILTITIDLVASKMPLRSAVEYRLEDHILVRLVRVVGAQPFNLGRRSARPDTA